MAGLSDGRGGVVDPLMLEQREDNASVQGLLESLKEQFLRTFNLSGMPPPAVSAREEPPEYMMELYNRFANDQSVTPKANIIRSFKNEDSSPSVVGTSVRRHSLLFNMSVPHHEHITAAQLRLYTLVQADRRLYAGVNRKVTVYELEPRGPDGDRSPSNFSTASAEGGAPRRLELASRQVYGTDDGWQAFDLTVAVQRWRSSNSTSTHQLEVHIASVGGGDDAAGPPTAHEARDGDLGDMEIDTGAARRHMPLLIVFSDDPSSDHRDDQRELSEMIDHETSESVGPHRRQQQQEEEDLVQMRSNLIYDSTSRIRRNARGNHCHKRPMYVEFKDIGWDSWILAPAGYEAFECAGLCAFPLTKHVTPTKHAIVQTLVNMKDSQRAAPACCVPTRLEPISLLYLDDTGVVTYKNKFEGMVVAECGCR